MSFKNQIVVVEYIYSLRDEEVIMFRIPKNDFLAIAIIISTILCIVVGIINVNDLEMLALFFLGIIVGMIKLGGTAYLINNIIKHTDIINQMLSFLLYFLSWFILIVFIYFVVKLGYKASIYSVLGVVSVTMIFLIFNYKKYFHKG